MPSLRPTLLVALAIVAVAGPAPATTAPDAEEAAITRAREWKGRYCPPAPRGLASPIGFAMATLGALALARRRST